MQEHFRSRTVPPLVLGALGAVLALLAALDKLFGLVQRPLFLATLAYASLFGLVAWAFLRGIQLRPARLFRLSLYAAALLLLVLTSAYVFAWRLSADPTPVILQRELSQARALVDAGELDRAHLIYREAYRRFPNSFPVLMGLGAVTYQTTDYDRARRYYERALAVAPPESRWRALNDLGQTLWKLKRPEEAIELYLQAEKAGMPRSERIEWHYRLAWAYFDLDEYDLAIHHYLQVAEAGGKYAAASYYNAACAQAQKLEQTSDPEERAELAEAAVENLRRSWQTAESAEERQDLRAGVFGTGEERDPDLEPLRGTPALTQLARELQ
ncbi:MAG: tetratricopeptide repeat protein [Armatimonadota bacterium]